MVNVSLSLNQTKFLFSLVTDEIKRTGPAGREFIKPLLEKLKKLIPEEGKTAKVANDGGVIEKDKKLSLLAVIQILVRILDSDQFCDDVSDIAAHIHPCNRCLDTGDYYLDPMYFDLPRYDENNDSIDFPAKPDLASDILLRDSFCDEFKKCGKDNTSDIVHDCPESSCFDATTNLNPQHNAYCCLEPDCNCAVETAINLIETGEIECYHCKKDAKRPEDFYRLAVDELIYKEKYIDLLKYPDVFTEIFPKHFNSSNKHDKEQILNVLATIRMTSNNDETKKMAKRLLKYCHDLIPLTLPGDEDDLALVRCDGGIETPSLTPQEASLGAGGAVMWNHPPLTPRRDLKSLKKMKKRVEKRHKKHEKEKKKKIKRALKALKKKMQGEHPSRQEMEKIARDGLYDYVQIIGRHNNVYFFDETETFSYYQYILFYFKTPNSNSFFTLTSLPWADVVEGVNTVFPDPLDPRIWVKEASLYELVSITDELDIAIDAVSNIQSPHFTDDDEEV